MSMLRPGIRGPRLPRVIGRTTGKNDHPPVEGLDNRPSYVVGYNPAIGIFPTIGFLMQENNDYLLQESGYYIIF